VRGLRIGAGRLAALSWAAPNSALGLLFALLAIPKGTIRHRDGVLECCAGRIPLGLRLLGRRGRIRAVTLGHVVLACDEAALAATREHERIHVRQYERYGPLFLPAYFASSIFALFRGGHVYFDNRFEAAAFAHAEAVGRLVVAEHGARGAVERGAV